MEYIIEGNKEVKVVKGFEDPFKQSEGKNGWVILRSDELDILKSLIVAFNEANVEEYDLSITIETEKKQFYR